MPGEKGSWRFAALTFLVGLAVGWGVWLWGPQPRLTLPGNGATLWPARFSADGGWLVIEKRGPKGDLLEHQVWGLDPPRVVLRFPPVRVYSRVFSDDGRWFAQASCDGDDPKGACVEFWDLEGGRERADIRWTDLPGSLPWNMSRSVLAFAADGRLLLGGTNFGLWDVAARKQIAPLEPLTPSGPMPNNWESALLGYERDRRVRLYSVGSQEVVGEFALPADIRNYRWSEDGQALAADFYLDATSGKDLAGIHVFDGRMGTRVRVGGAHEQVIQSVSSDSQWLAVSGESALTEWWRRLLKREHGGNPVIQLYHAPTDRLCHVLPGLTARFAPNSAALAVRMSAGDVTIWDVPPVQPWLPSIGWAVAAMTVVRLGTWIVRAKPRWRPWVAHSSS